MFSTVTELDILPLSSYSQQLAAIHVAQYWPVFELLFIVAHKCVILWMCKRTSLLQPKSQPNMLLLLAFEAH